MTNQQHPITPPQELVQQWMRDKYELSGTTDMCELQLYLVQRAAQWAADQELEACVQWMDTHPLPSVSYRADYLRAARRPKPLSLKEQALEAWERQMASYEETDADMDTIRRALERLQELEGGN